MLTDKFLNHWHFGTTHSIITQANSNLCFEIARSLDMSQSRIIRFLFWLRGLPTIDLTLPGFTKNMRFTLLEEDPPREFIYGFWRERRIEWITDKEAFISSPAGSLKVVWNFSFEEVSHGCRVTTETRILCMNPTARRWFSVYWFFVRPFSGLVRRECLRLIRKEALLAQSSSSFLQDNMD